MYDIEFTLAICLKGKYKRRLEEFKKYGILNIKDRKVLVTLLSETDSVEAKEGWPEGIDVNLIHCPSTHEASKIYHYFSKHAENRLDKVRWFAKVDDDSSTDVDTLLTELDEMGDHKKEFYFVASRLDNIEPEEYNLVKEFGYGHWFEKQSPHHQFVSHEVEGSFLSQAAMRTILTNPTAKRFLDERATISAGYTDIALACAARICKIYITETPFLTCDPLVGNYSIFGGDLCHIHYIGPDVNHQAWEYLSSTLRDKDKNDLWDQVVGKKYILNREKDYFCIVEFRKDSKIIIHSPREDPPYDWSLWSTPNNQLCFIGWEGQKIINFDQTDADEFTGTCVWSEDDPAKYYLRGLR